MIEILRLYFDKGIRNESIAWYTIAEGLEKTGILTELKVFFELDTNCIMLAWDNFLELNRFSVKLKLGIDQNLFLHKSIKKQIGYYKNQYRKNENRKNLTYESTDIEYTDWVGDRYRLFDFGDIDSWLYNDKDGAIVFELTPVYPWFYSDPELGETFIKYSDWMKQYQPLLKRIISKEVAQEWLVKLQELTTLVQKISKTLPCGGMLDCGGCIHLGKQND